MSNTMNRVRNGQAALALAFTLGMPAVLGVPALAQTTHHSFLHRHPHLATAGAGLGAYALAKHSHHGFFHRHPIMTGLGAAAIAHHYAKKHRY